jgi:hypothetical protein
MREAMSERHGEDRAEKRSPGAQQERMAGRSHVEEYLIQQQDAHMF